MNKLYVLLPCYNEALNIADLIDDWMAQEKGIKEAGYALMIRPVNDCSTDDTKKVILDMQKKYPENVQLIDHEVNKNLCGVLNTSISFFEKNGKDGDLMCLMDGDNTHDPAYIHAMLKKLVNGCDCVIASRYREGSDVVGLSGIRKFMSDGARLYYTLMLNVPNVRDYTCGYRVYTKQAIDRLVQKFGDEPIKEKTFACMMEFLYKLYLSGARFDEVGFKLRYDKKQGESKMKVGKTMINSLKTALKLRMLPKA